MKDQTVFGVEPTRTPIAGVDWAGEAEVGDVTLSDQETLMMERVGPSRFADPADDFEEASAAAPRARVDASWRFSEFFVHAWSLARSSLLGAVVCGVGGGLLLGIVLVLAIRVARAQNPSLASSSDAPLLVTTVRVQQPSGTPVVGARVQSGKRSLEVDAQGLAVFEENLPEASAAPPRFRFELACPANMRAFEGTREFVVASSGSRPAKRIERSLTFSCESTEVELLLLLHVEGGEARFWLGQEELGSTVEGRLEKTVRIPKRSETVLRVEPIVPKGEKREPRVTPLERTVVVLDEAVRVEHIVKIEWPRRRVRAHRPTVPYRL